jgi:beta-lactamase class D
MMLYIRQKMKAKTAQSPANFYKFLIALINLISNKTKTPIFKNKNPFSAADLDIYSFGY